MQSGNPIRKWIQPIRIILWIGLFTSMMNAQTAQILKTEGNVAVINKGGNANIRIGDEFRIYRPYGGRRVEIARARATHVTRNLTRIKLIEFTANQALKTNDQVVQIPGKDGSRSNLFNIYLGPSVGMFVPLKGMDKYFETNIAYGGILGFRFRRDLDLNVRFLFAAETSTNNWSFWNLQMLGRRFYQNNFSMDFGYGVAYPRMNASLGNGEIRLGFIGGFGVTMPVSPGTIFELGAHYHYYPYFGGNPGQFITIEARVML